MASPNLNIPHVAATQNDKETTINNGIDLLDSGTQGNVTWNCSASSFAVPSSTFRRYAVHRMQNNVSARSLTFTAISRMFVFVNEGTVDGAAVVGSVTVSVAAGSAALMWAYATGLKRIL